MVKGFRDFIMKGNVIDLAVAFVIGAAFAALVSTFVSKIVKPILAAFQGPESIGLGFYLRPGNPATFVDIGGLINAVIVFLVTALVVYLLFVVPKQRFDEFRERRAGTVEEVERGTRRADGAAARDPRFAPARALTPWRTGWRPWPSGRWPVSRRGAAGRRAGAARRCRRGHVAPDLVALAVGSAHLPAGWSGSTWRRTRAPVGDRSGSAALARRTRRRRTESSCRPVVPASVAHHGQQRSPGLRRPTSRSPAAETP